MATKSAFLMGAAVALSLAAFGATTAARAGQLKESRGSTSVVMPGVEVHRVTVSYSHLNLREPADVARLYRRVALAADQACGSRYFLGSHAVSAFWTACRDRAIRAAVASVRQPELTAYARGRAQAR